MAAFNSTETIISERIASLFYFVLLILLLIQISLSIFVFSFVNSNVELWRDVKILFVM